MSRVWIDNPEAFLDNLCFLQDKGSESVVYFDVEKRIVYKLISLKHYNVLRLALDRIIIHNALFPETSMEVIGFARDSKQQFVTVVIQPYIIGDLITEDERISFMHGLDFDDAGMDYGMHLNYKTDTLYVGDLNEFNVIKGETGLNVIDADCRLNVPTLECGGKYSITHPEIDFSNPYSEWLEYLVTGQKF